MLTCGAPGQGGVVLTPDEQAMRRVLSARTRGSLARARSAGRVGGRQPKLTAEADATIRARRDTGTAVPELAGACGGLRNPEG
jgi:DNA invertase Pin-like site-specific DNA recombinase